MGLSWISTLKNEMDITGNIEKDVESFFKHFNALPLFLHSVHVAQECRNLANLFHINEKSAYIAGYLHDISSVIPKENIMEAVLDLNIAVLPEETQFPYLLYQKLSAALAQELFHIDNKEIVSALQCHTTLKKKCKKLDLILFVADKMKWGKIGNPPYIAAIHLELQKSLEHAAYCYITYVWERRDQYQVIHPWLIEAYDDLKKKLEISFTSENDAN